MKSFVSVIASMLVVSSGAADFKIKGSTFTAPEGFSVELIAETPLVDRPIVADFDEFGRLYVADSSGTNDKIEKQLAEKPHRIVRLEDTNDDGVFDKSVVFADKMMFPEGAMFYRGSLYVGAPPSIWKLTDTNGDGVADEREEWMQGKTLTGCANDLHGPYLGPDGWIYWAKGAFAEQTYALATGKTLKTKAAHLFRRRPEGGPIEPVMTGGMDNPVEIAFSATGERFFTTTFFQNPGGGQRDGLVHAVYGGVYGKQHDAIDGHPRTGELMPVMTHLGAAAPSGLMRYESSVFGADHRDNLFAALFNLHKVTRHQLRPFGGGFKTVDSDFLTSDDPDFHPTDVLMDADGSLIVIDTGGWYKLCCPTSQLAKPDVLGAIYRIRKTGAGKVADPRGFKVRPLKFPKENPGLELAELIKRLSDPRPAVIARTIEECSLAGEQSVRNLKSALSSDLPEVRRNAIWALTRVSGPSAREAVRTLLDDSDETVRWAATHSASVRRDKGALYNLTTLLQKGSPGVRRATAEALGRIGDKTTIAPLLAAFDTAKGFDPMDRPLEHSLTYALIEIGDATELRKHLGKGNIHQQKAALIALDQIDGDHLQAADILPLLSASEATLRETARWIAGQHPEWGDALAGVFGEKLKVADGELEADLARFGKSKAIQELLTSTLRASESSRETKTTALRAMKKSGLRELPPGLADGIMAGLTSAEPAVRLEAIKTAREFNQSKQNFSGIKTALLKLAASKEEDAALRLEAMAAIPGRLDEIDSAVFEFLRSKVASDQPVATRASAASVLARSKLTEEQLVALTENVKTAGPMEVIQLLGAYEGSTQEKVGVQLASALRGSASLTALRPDIIKTRFAKYPAPVQDQANELVKMLNKDADQQNAHIEELLSQIKGGDVRRGQAIFNSPQAACASCHALGYLGGKAGPDLTSIGTIRTERDLLESIVYPSASFVRSYEPVTVITKSGDNPSGVLKKDAADEVIVGTGPETEIRIARADVVEMQPGSVSIMPQGLDQQLTKQQLADLVAFLKNTKWGAQ